MHTPFQNDNHFDLRPNFDLHKPLMYTATLLASVLLTSSGSQKGTHRRLETANLTTSSRQLGIPGMPLTPRPRAGPKQEPSAASCCPGAAPISARPHRRARPRSRPFPPSQLPWFSCLYRCCRPELPAESKLGSHSAGVVGLWRKEISVFASFYSGKYARTKESEGLRH